MHIKISKLFKNILLLLVSLLTSLLLLEGWISLFIPSLVPSTLFKCHYNQDGTLLAPAGFKGHQRDNGGDFDVTIIINKNGFRDNKDFLNSTKNDLFVVGDSISFGQGVEEDKRYSDIIQSMIGVRTFNICLPGADFDDYDRLINYATNNGAIINNLIIGVCMENDLNRYYTGKRDAYKIADYQRSPIQKIKNYFYNRSSTYHAFALIMNSNNFLTQIGRFFYIMGDPLDQIHGVINNRDILLESVKKLKELSIRFHSVMVIIPSRGLWVGSNQAIEKVVHNEFVKLLIQEGLEIVDLRPQFEDCGNPLQYHFRHDGHWNNEGHQKAAESIYKYLLQNNIWGCNDKGQ